MLSLINDMLDFVQSEEGKMNFFFQTFDILDLVKEVCQMISFKAR
jgi:signal transduction histidine kinase